MSVKVVGGDQRLRLTEALLFYDTGISQWRLLQQGTRMWKTHMKYVVVHSLSCVWLYVTAGVCTTLGFPVHYHLQSLLKLISIELVMPSSHLILCHPLLLLLSIFPSIRVFSNELAVHIRWPKCWGFSFSISPSKEYSGLIFLGSTGLISLLSKRLSRVSTV